MNNKKIIDKKEVYNNFLDRAVNMAKQGKRQNILTPGFYDAVRVGKDFFDLSQEEVYDEIERRLNGEMQELIVPEASEEDVERQKEMNKELDTTLDTQKKISDLKNEASDEDVQRQEKMKDAVDATTDSIEKATDASEKSDVAERIANKVREKLEKETMNEGKKESTADIKQRIKDLVQKLKDQNDHLYPEGAKDLAIDMIKKMDIKEALKFMGTADEETMKYLLQDIGREELENFEKQFVVMFDLLRDIRYDGSEQLSKGASEISQRIHDFITIFRQALKGYPVVKEETINEEDSYLDKKEAVDILAILNTLRDAAREIQTMQYYGTDKMQKLADKIHGTGAMYKIINMLKQEYENKKEGTIKENISSDTRKYMLDKKLDFEGIKKLEKQMVEVSRILKDLEKNGGNPLSSKAAKAGNALGEVSYIFRQMLRDVDNDRLDKEFETGTYESKSLTNNHSNPVTEAAKKKLVSRINSIALKEGISKKEATIKAIKALQESK